MGIAGSFTSVGVRGHRQLPLVVRGPWTRPVQPLERADCKRSGRLTDKNLKQPCTAGSHLSWPLKRPAER
jgi:hypothetical protein